MSVLSVRVDKETEGMLEDMAKKRGIPKSDLVRFLIIKGLESANNNSEVMGDIYQELVRNNATTEKNLRTAIQTFALTIRILTHLDPEEFDEAMQDAKRLLEKNGVEA